MVERMTLISSLGDLWVFGFFVLIINCKWAINHCSQSQVSFFFFSVMKILLYPDTGSLSARLRTTGSLHDDDWSMAIRYSEVIFFFRTDHFLNIYEEKKQFIHPIHFKMYICRFVYMIAILIFDILWKCCFI